VLSDRGQDRPLVDAAEHLHALLKSRKFLECDGLLMHGRPLLLAATTR
jgi:hypothetical protein